jgi:hypothetical protein
MAELEINVTRIDGKALAGRHAYDEFSPMSLAWQAPGTIYRWLDRHPQVLAERKRQGWKICNVTDDFVNRGCPSDLLPASDVPTGEIIFGESILGQMPLTVANQRYKRNIIDKAAERTRGRAEIALAEGERTARELRARGVTVRGGNVVERVDQREAERDWGSPYDLTTRDKQGQVINPQFDRSK